MVKISRLFLTLLGFAFLINFWVLHDQVLSLIGEKGLLPIAADLPLIKEQLGFSAYSRFPTLFWVNASDAVLYWGTWAGLILSAFLIFKKLTRYVLIALWLLFLSYCTAGRTFYSFQWDNLMLEATFLAFFLPTKKEVEPNTLIVWLFRILAFKLHFESGMAKIWAGKLGGWLDFSAMQHYYNTAPIPTWLGWWAHQAPLWFHQIETGMALFVETVVPLFIFFGRRGRVLAFMILFPLQIFFLLTANYGIFNYMSMAALLFLLEDKDLKWIGIKSNPAYIPVYQRLNLFIKGTAYFLILVSVMNFIWFLKPSLAQKIDILNITSSNAPLRSMNNYHLFASMTPKRYVVEIQGTRDGINWKVYPFRYYPGDIYKRPRFVAPYHPRLDFRLWFLTLSNRSMDWVYFTRLMGKIFHEPESVDDYFEENPFPDKPPVALRFVIYEYNMTDSKQRRETGAWWQRTPIHRSKNFFPENFNP